MSYQPLPTSASDLEGLKRFVNDELIKISRETVDQEQGIWTPALTVGSGSYTISSSGEYTKIGRAVHFSGSIQFSASSVSGTVEITGLPLSQVSGKGIVHFRYENLSGVVAGVTGYVDGKKIRVQAQTATGATNPTLTATSLLEFSGSYLV